MNQPLTITAEVHDNESRFEFWEVCWTRCQRSGGDFGPMAPIGYGPWSPPLQPTSAVWTFTHTYEAPGTYRIWVVSLAYGYYMDEDCPGDASAHDFGGRRSCLDPYFEPYAGGSITVTVEP